LGYKITIAAGEQEVAKNGLTNACGFDFKGCSPKGCPEVTEIDTDPGPGSPAKGLQLWQRVEVELRQLPSFSVCLVSFFRPDYGIALPS